MFDFYSNITSQDDRGETEGEKGSKGQIFKTPHTSLQLRKPSPHESVF